MEKELKLAQEDVSFVLAAIFVFRLIVLCFALVMAIGLVWFFFFSGATFAIIISVVGFLFAAVAGYALFYLKRDIRAGVKFVQRGQISNMEIKVAGATVTFEVLENEYVRINEQMASGNMTSTEPMTLPQGKSDMRFYEITIDETAYKITRLEFFTFQMGDEVYIERLTSGKVIKLEKR